ncbi:hypothetical protein [Amycolatopsis cihanbeyliensis]|uniref:Uncharacterized protein n=1 Tax=Amycolatopsis cihanbeyliensis TaxID=1128664 RepID=A0A542CUF1_AMYCI|nr:hypothetical protein [Amycolatopsis cihanbeyliensis]TQI94456.1 hypothetical protein FB471_6621 [Amycolatopsis cihanbeyliensis]
MPSLFSKAAKLAAYARSPQGRKVINQAKELANDPRRRAQAKEMLNKLRDRTGGKGEGNPPPPPR